MGVVRNIDLHRVDTEPREQRLIMLDVGIAGGKQLLAVENRVRAGEKA